MHPVICGCFLVHWGIQIYHDGVYIIPSRFNCFQRLDIWHYGGGGTIGIVDLVSITTISRLDRGCLWLIHSCIYRLFIFIDQSRHEFLTGISSQHIWPCILILKSADTSIGSSGRGSCHLRQRLRRRRFQWGLHCCSVYLPSINNRNSSMGPTSAESKDTYCGIGGVWWIIWWVLPFDGDLAACRVVRLPSKKGSVTW